MTVSSWVKTDDVTSFIILSKGTSSSSSEYDFLIDSGDDLALVLYNTGSLNLIRAESSLNLASYEGEWVHVAATHDGSESASGINWFVNGKQISDNDSTLGSYFNMDNTAGDFYIGSSPNDFSTTNSDGQIDDLRFYNYILTQQQIRDIRLLAK